MDWLRSGNPDSRLDSVASTSGSLMSTLAKMAELEVFFLSPDCVILMANNAAAKAAGLLVSDLIGRRIDEVLPGLCQRVEMIRPELERTGAVLVDQGMPEARQGQSVLYDTYVVFVRDMLEDSALGWVVVRLDATLRASLQHTVEALPMPMAILRVPELTLELANSSFIALLAPSESLAATTPGQPGRAIAMMASAAARTGESSSHHFMAGRPRSALRTDWTVFCCRSSALTKAAATAKPSSSGAANEGVPRCSEARHRAQVGFALIDNTNLRPFCIPLCQRRIIPLRHVRIAHAIQPAAGY